MSISIKVIDRLFERLSVTYGAAWIRMYEGMDSNAVKSVWMHELDGFEDKLHAIAWALDHLPERVPNVVEFRGMCRAAPALIVPMLTPPKADPERVKAAFEKLNAPAPEDKYAQYGGAAWAYRIVDKHNAGSKRYAALTLKMAREVVERKGVMA